jgi:hypothetical protein
MANWNPKKQLTIEIVSNDLSNCNGYTVWRIVNGEAKDTLSRRADGKDFDWMTEKQMQDFENGKYRFKISAEDASEFFEYIY